MHVTLFTCAESFAVDSRSNRPSLFHVLDEFDASEFPVMLPQLHVVAMLERSPHEPEATNANLSVTFGGDSVPLVDAQFAIAFEGKLRARTFGLLQGLAIPAPGIVTATLSMNGQKKASWKITVTQNGQLPLGAAL